MTGTHEAPDGDDINKATRRANGANGAGQRSRFTPIAWQDYDYEPAHADDLLQGMLPREGLAVLFAKWKSFKTFVALDLAVAVARGEPWAGRKTKQGTVIYVVCEGQLGFRKRVAAYKAKHRLSHLDFHVINARPSLGTHRGDADELIKAIANTLRGGSAALVVIDTLARTLGGKDENGEGMQNFINNAEDIADSLGCLVLAIHHEGAGNTGRMRGYTMLDAATVATWRIRRDKTSDRLSCTLIIMEAKDAASDIVLNIRLARFEFGDEHDEQRESTLIVDQIEVAAAVNDNPASTQKPSPERIEKDLHAFLTSFDIALHEKGRDRRLPNNGPKVKAVSIETVRPIYYDKRADLDKQDSKKTAFRRDLKKAIKHEVLVSSEIGGEALLWRAARK